MIDIEDELGWTPLTKLCLFNNFFDNDTLFSLIEKTIRKGANPNHCFIPEEGSRTRRPILHGIAFNMKRKRRLGNVDLFNFFKQFVDVSRGYWGAVHKESGFVRNVVFGVNQKDAETILLSNYSKELRAQIEIKPVEVKVLEP